MNNKSQKNKIGFAITGSFCTHSKIKKIINSLHEKEYEIFPIVSFNAANMDSRFGNCDDFLKSLEEITGKENIKTIQNAETIGPGNFLDALVIAPCTGTTMALLAAGISATPVTLAAKSMLRGGRPVVIGVSTNDGLSGSVGALAALLQRKNYYFIPFGQDDSYKKPCSLKADFTQLPDTLEAALRGVQLQPILL